MNAAPIKIAWLVLLAALSTSCATTGDPTRGGLFGWSEEKAKARRTDLEREAREARIRAATAQAKRHELDSKERQIAGTIDGLETNLAKIKAENAELRKNFEKLIKEQRYVNDDLAKLEIELNRTDQEFSGAPPVSFAEEHAEQIKWQNNRLHSAILFMLQQR